MNKFFERVGKLSHKQSKEVAILCASVALLLLVAAGIAGGGMQKVNHLLALAGITSESQTACVWPCNNSAYDMEALIPMQGGSPVSTVQPGTAVNWQWNAGSYGASNFAVACAGASNGPNYVCTVQINTPNTNFAACSYPTKSCTGGYQTVCTSTKTGTTCSPQCISYGYSYDTAHCGNADDYYGHACFGSGGGYTPTGSQPQCANQNNNAGAGYDGNYPASTLSLAAPVTPGTYTYYFCSNWLLNANAHNSSLTPLPCLGASLTVASPPPTCSLTSASVYYGQPANLTYGTTNATGVTYSIDGVNQGAPAGNPFNTNPSGTLAIANHNVTMTVTGPGGSGTCGGANYVVINTPPAPSCTLSPANQTVFTGNPASFTYTYSNQGAVPTYKVDGGTATTPSGSPFSVSSLAAGTHNVIMTVVNSVGAAATCGAAGNVTVTTIPLPTPTISAGSTTVKPNATTTLTWSTANLGSGQCSLTAPSSSATATNFAGLYSGSNMSTYWGSVYVIANGYVYRLGGYNGTAYTFTASKAALGSDMTNSANWLPVSALTLPSTFVNFAKPVVVAGTAYFFGGYNPTSSWVNTICSVPLTNIENSASWNCSAAGPNEISDVVIIGNYLYRFGGYNGSVGIASVSRAPVSAPTTWTSYPSVLPQAIYGAGVAIIGNYVYLFGGYNTTTLNTIYRALITSDFTLPSSWTSAGTIQTAAYAAATVVDGSNVYIIGGYSAAAASMSTVQSASIASVTAGAPVWSNPVTLPYPDYWIQPVVTDTNLYLMSGYNSVAATYVNKMLLVPFNTGKPYTSSAMPPWLVDNQTNNAWTWPISANSTTYSLQCTNTTGTNSASVTINEPDLCTNAPFNGIQNPVPSGVTAAGTTCSCTAGGTTWNGSSCVVTATPLINTPTISTLLSGSLTAVKRVKKGSHVVLNWNVTGLTPNDVNTSCSVSSQPANAMTPLTLNGSTNSLTTWTQSASPPSVTINGTTVFTVSCTNSTWAPNTISTSATVGLIPTYQEQ